MKIKTLLDLKSNKIYLLSSKIHGFNNIYARFDKFENFGLDEKNPISFRRIDFDDGIIWLVYQNWLDRVKIKEVKKVPLEVLCNLL
jgi:hypothetical protein